MHGRLHGVIALALAAAPVVAHADDGGTAKADDWRFRSTSRSDAVRVQANTLYPATLAEVRLSYRHIDDGGSLSALTGLVQVPMPYILVPGVRASNWFSLGRARAAGGDAQAPNDLTSNRPRRPVAARRSHHALGPMGRRIRRRHADSNRDREPPRERIPRGRSGRGAVGLLRLRTAADSRRCRSRASRRSPAHEDRSDLNVLLVRPTLTYILPHATYVALESRMSSDWERRGHTTVPLTGRFGIAANDHVVVVLEPTWIARGDGQHDLTITLITSYVDW